MDRTPKVLDCASPLALFDFRRSLKAAEGSRRPGRYALTVR